MDRFIAVVVPDEKKAYECVQELRELHREGSVTVYATAVVERSQDRELSVKERSDVGPVGAALGTMIGALSGMIAGPAGAIAGAASGGLIGAWGQYGVHAEVSEEFGEDITRELRPGTFAVLAEVDEDWTTPIDARLGALGGKIVRESREAFVEELFQKQVDAAKTKLEKFRSDRETAKVEKMQTSLELEIQSTAEKLRRRADKAKQQLDHRKEELDAKLKRLEEQASKAEPDVKRRIQQRIADLRKGFDERLEKLRRAYEMTQEALRA